MCYVLTVCQSDVLCTYLHSQPRCVIYSLSVNLNVLCTYCLSTWMCYVLTLCQPGYVMYSLSVNLNVLCTDSLSTWICYVLTVCTDFTVLTFCLSTEGLLYSLSFNLDELRLVSWNLLNGECGIGECQNSMRIVIWCNRENKLVFPANSTTIISRC